MSCEGGPPGQQYSVGPALVGRNEGKGKSEEGRKRAGER